MGRGPGPSPSVHRAGAGHAGLGGAGGRAPREVPRGYPGVRRLWGRGWARVRGRAGALRAMAEPAPVRGAVEDPGRIEIRPCRGLEWGPESGSEAAGDCP